MYIPLDNDVYIAQTIDHLSTINMEFVDSSNRWVQSSRIELVTGSSCCNFDLDITQLVSLC